MKTENDKHQISERCPLLCAPGREKMLEWSAALSAAGLGYKLCRRGDEWLFSFSDEEAAAAHAEIEACEHACAGITARTDETHSSWAPAWGSLFLVWFYLWLGPYNQARSAALAGAADAASIVSGEWWRVITSLTLHTGWPHLVGNVLVLFLFSHAACRMLGGGLGWLLILASGAAGNSVTALLASSGHTGVGASTACFGALGVISTFQSIRLLRNSDAWRPLFNRAWIPVWAGLALLGLIGTGPGSDLASHAFGFAAGAIIAVPFAWKGAAGLPAWAQRALELLCIAVVMLCWQAAFISIA